MSLRFLSRGVAELLAGDRDLAHQPALRNGEYRHALVIFTARNGILHSTADAGFSAVRTGARRRAGSHGGDTGIRSELERAGLELIQCSLVREKNDLAECFAARLKPDAEFRHRDIAHPFSMNVNMTSAMRSADAQRALTDGREYRVSVALVEKGGTLARILEQSDGVAIAALGISRSYRQRQHCASCQYTIHDSHNPDL